MPALVLALALLLLLELVKSKSCIASFSAFTFRSAVDLIRLALACELAWAPAAHRLRFGARADPRVAE